MMIFQLFQGKLHEMISYDVNSKQYKPGSKKSPLSKSRCYTDISWLTSLDQFGAIRSSKCSAGEAMDV